MDETIHHITIHNFPFHMSLKLRACLANKISSLNFRHSISITHHSSLITHHSLLITHYLSLNFSHPFAFITQFPSLIIFHTIWRAHACHSAAFFFFSASSFFFFFFFPSWVGCSVWGFFFFFFTKFGESRYKREKKK